MGSITGIPTTRLSDAYIRLKLMKQVQSSQVELFNAQQQMSTGRRFALPSDDPIAAQRAMGLQTLIERKAQVKANLQVNQSYLGATDSAMGAFNDLIADARGIAIGMSGTTSSDVQRAAAAQEVGQAMKQLLDTANIQFRGRYLFAGTLAGTQPFETAGNSVRYNGNEEHLQSYGDVDLLFDSNVTGSQVLGAISDPVRGTVDLDPALNFNTRLVDLYQGGGISKGSIAVSDGNFTSVVDLSQAETIGDVAALIRAHPPQGRRIEVDVTPDGLWLKLVGGGQLAVTEVGSGTTARELGVYTPPTTGSDTIVGDPLNPAVTATTLLGDLIGRRARAVLRSTADGADIVFEAPSNGAATNGVTVQLVDDPTVEPGHETVLYNAGTRTLSVGIAAGFSKASDVVDAVHAAYLGGTSPLDARVDPVDQVRSGEGIVDATLATTAGGRDGQLDKTSGLRIVNGGATHNIDFAAALTVEDLLNTLNMSSAGVLAQINATHAGLDIRTRLGGEDFMIGENGGTTASDLGVRSFSGATRLEDLNYGFGIPDDEGGGLAAEAHLGPSNTNYGMVLRSRTQGAQWNNYAVEIADSGGPVGSESVVYDTLAKTITLNVVPGTTTANDMLNVFRGTPGVRDDFELVLDSTTNTGNGLLAVTNSVTAGGADAGVDFIIQRPDGTQLEINTHGAATIQDVLDRINNHPDNDPLNPLLARLNRVGNGIELVDNSAGTGVLTVMQAHMSQVANKLGLIPEGQTSRSTASGGPPLTLSGGDVHPGETNGIFTALARLKSALEENDQLGIQHAVKLLDDGLTRLSFVRAENGAQQQGLDVLLERQDAENIELQANLSQEVDADFTQAASDFTGRQIAYQAALQTAAAISKMSLMDYL